jgi:hypothetical protein
MALIKSTVGAVRTVQNSRVFQRMIQILAFVQSIHYSLYCSWFLSQLIQLVSSFCSVHTIHRSRQLASRLAHIFGYWIRNVLIRGCIQ